MRLRANHAPFIIQSELERKDITYPMTTTSNDTYGARNRYLFALVILLLVVFASRVVRLNTLQLDRDEVWSVWQTFGSPADIIKWTPYDWSPLYYLVVGFWRALTGIHPFVLRLLSVYTFMIAMTFLYRLTRRLYGSKAGIIAVTACAALGFAVNISLMLRAYDMLFCTAILSWWLALRYFHRFTVMRGVILGVSLAITFYFHFTGIFAAALIGLYTLVVYGRKVWRWWLPAVVLAALILPVVIARTQTSVNISGNNGPIIGQWLAGGATILLELVRTLMIDYAGYNFVLWAALIVVAAFLIFDQYRFNRRTVALALWVISPLFLFVMGYFGGFTNRHTTWLMAAFAIWIGAGLKALPRPAILGVLGVLTVIMFEPVPIERYRQFDAPLVSAFGWLSERVQNGDEVLIDPDYKAVPPEEWDYFTRAYFPNGLNYVTTPGSVRRVWYIHSADQQNQPVQQNRIVTDQFNLENFVVQLYEAPPDVAGVDFSNGIHFHGVDALNSATDVPVWREGETIKLRLWWSTDQPLKVDLSVGTYVLDGTTILAQSDGAPQVINGPQQTSQWQPNQYYIEERELTLKYPLPMADYTVQTAVYQSWDGKRFAVPGHDDGLLPILQFHVMSWSSPH